MDGRGRRIDMLASVVPRIPGEERLWTLLVLDHGKLLLSAATRRNLRCCRDNTITERRKDGKREPTGRWKYRITRRLSPDTPASAGSSFSRGRGREKKQAGQDEMSACPRGGIAYINQAKGQFSKDCMQHLVRDARANDTDNVSSARGASSRILPKWVSRTTETSDLIPLSDSASPSLVILAPVFRTSFSSRQSRHGSFGRDMSGMSKFSAVSESSTRRKWRGRCIAAAWCSLPVRVFICISYLPSSSLGSTRPLFLYLTYSTPTQVLGCDLVVLAHPSLRLVASRYACL